MNNNDNYIGFVLINKEKKQALKAELLGEELMELINRLQDVYRTCITENKENGYFEIIVLDRI